MYADVVRGATVGGTPALWGWEHKCVSYAYYTRPALLLALTIAPCTAGGGSAGDATPTARSTRRSSAPMSACNTHAVHMHAVHMHAMHMHAHAHAAHVHAHVTCACACCCMCMLLHVHVVACACACHAHVHVHVHVACAWCTAGRCGFEPESFLGVVQLPAVLMYWAGAPATATLRHAAPRLSRDRLRCGSARCRS